MTKRSETWLIIFLIIFLILGVFGCSKKVAQDIGSIIKNTPGGTASSPTSLDKTAPTIASISAPDATTIVITFSELLDKTSAETVSNYTVAPGLTITSAKLGKDGKTVTLTTAKQPSGSNYSIQVSGVKDIYSNQISSSASGSSANFAPGNATPVANAGSDQIVNPGVEVTLDGTGSSDGDGDSLTYSWSVVSQPSGSSISLSSVTTSKPTFTATIVGNYVFGLIVNDGKVNSTTNTVNILIDSKPVANAGADQSSTTNFSITLDGSGSSDADGDAISYLWSVQTQPSYSSITLANSNTVSSSFTPSISGTYVISLRVTDSWGVTSNIDTVTITISGNSTPVANAGLDQQTTPVTLVTLDGSSSIDVDGNTITYSWSFTTRPSGSASSLTNAQTQNPTFTPDKTGKYEIQLIVNDGTINSSPDTVIVTANTTPQANAGGNQTVHVGSSVTLSGSSSSDPDNDTITYNWTITNKPSGSSVGTQPNNHTGAIANFTTDKVGAYAVQLLVNDGYVSSNASTAIITATNTAPVANAGTDITATINVTTNVSLGGGSSSDADSDSLTYSWTIVTKPTNSSISLSGSSTATANFTPDKIGTYTFKLTVSDAWGSSSTDQINVTGVTPTSYAYDSKYTNSNFKDPMGLALQGSYIYVVGKDSVNTPNIIRLYKSTMTGSTLISGYSTTADGKFFSPIDIAVDKNGYIYVSDWLRHDVQKFYSSGTYKEKLGTTGTSGDDHNKFNLPYGICVDDYRLYVADLNNKKVKIYNLDLTWYGEINVTPNTPLDIAVNSDTGIIYVACVDTVVRMYTIGGIYQSSFVALYSYFIYVDKDGYILKGYTTDDTIRKYNSSGTSVCTISSSGSLNGELDCPFGIAVDTNGYIYVAEYDNDRIQKFKPQ